MYRSTVRGGQAPRVNSSGEAASKTAQDTSRGGQSNPGTGTKRPRSRGDDDDDRDLDALVNGGGGGRRRGEAGGGGQGGRGAAGGGRGEGWRTVPGKTGAKRNRGSETSTLGILDEQFEVVEGGGHWEFSTARNW